MRAVRPEHLLLTEQKDNLLPLYLAYYVIIEIHQVVKRNDFID